MRRVTRPRVYEVEETFSVGGIDVETVWKCRLDDGERTWLVRFDVDGERISTDVDEEEVPWGVRDTLHEAVSDDERSLAESTDR
jgi:hypothetical protein